MRKRFLLLLASLILLGLGVACGLGAAPEAPPPQEPQSVPAVLPTAASAPEQPAPGEPPPIQPPAPGQPSPTPITPAEAAPTLFESRRLTLEFPLKIRVGDTDILRLTLEMDEGGMVTPTAEFGGHTVAGGTVQIPNLYETHRVYAEADLDLAGMQIDPSNVQSDELLPGRAVTFYWTLHPSDIGLHRGVVSLYLRFVPLAGGEASRMTVSKQAVEIRSVKLLGLSGGPARLAGAAGTVLGTVLGLPFVDDILRWIWRRLRRKA